MRACLPCCAWPPPHQFLAGGFLIGLLTRRAVLVDMGELSEHFTGASAGGGCRWNYGSIEQVKATIQHAVGGEQVWERDGWSETWGEGGGSGERARKNRALKTTAAVPMAWVELLACVDLGLWLPEPGAVCLCVCMCVCVCVCVPSLSPSLSLSLPPSLFLSLSFRMCAGTFSSLYFTRGEALRTAFACIHHHYYFVFFFSLIIAFAFMHHHDCSSSIYLSIYLDRVYLSRSIDR